MSGIEVRAYSNIGAINEGDWDKLARPTGVPFLEHTFLHQLEQCDCVGTEASGWLPRHLIAWRDEKLIGALPLYEKYNCQGEYIFDYHWAEGAHHAGITYFPKLTSAIPFTPITSPKILARTPDAKRALLEALQSFASHSPYSSAHLLFLDRDQQETICEQSATFMPRLSFQFHWQNTQGWQSFEDYLSSLRRSPRRNIERERRRLKATDIRTAILTGDKLEEREWEALWRFYCDTTARKYATRYLNKRFFEALAGNFRHRIIATFAYRAERPIAASLFFHGAAGLFGRYWGCEEEVPDLHFELCYYLPIEWCINEGVQHFEAGAQGPHKLKRGFLASPCFSAHHINHPALQQAIGHHIKAENILVQQQIAAFNRHSPFKKASDGKT